MFPIGETVEYSGTGTGAGIVSACNLDLAWALNGEDTKAKDPNP